jgi:hypothetical protein
MHNMLSSMLYITYQVPITCPIHPKHVCISLGYILTRQRAVDWHLRLLADLIFSLIDCKSTVTNGHHVGGGYGKLGVI